MLREHQTHATNALDHGSAGPDNAAHQVSGHVHARLQGGGEQENRRIGE